MQTNIIKIWEPKYSTNEVLIGKHHVASGMNEIVFTRAPHLEGKVYLMDGEKIRSFPKQPNGKGFVYCVPMTELTLK
jgi:hypothetical protein